MCVVCVQFECVYECTVSVRQCVCCYLKKKKKHREIFPYLILRFEWVANKWNEYKVMSETLKSRVNFILFCVLLPCHVYGDGYALLWIGMGNLRIFYLQLRDLNLDINSRLCTTKGTHLSGAE